MKKIASRSVRSTLCTWGYIGEIELFPVGVHINTDSYRRNVGEVTQHLLRSLVLH